MDKKIFILFLIILISISCALLIYNLCIKNDYTKLEIEENMPNITYKIYNNYNQGNHDYSKRGYYIDTLNQPNAPYYYIITMGEQQTGGYSISIKDVKIDKENNVEVIVKETKSNGTATMAFTYPVCCLELSSYPNSIIIKNNKGEVFQEIVKQNSLHHNENFISENIIGQWYPNDITTDGEERSLSSYFGYNINEKNYFEFYADGTYIKQLGDLDERGNYKIVNNKIYMNSDLGQVTIAEFTVDENGNKSVVEKDNELIISYLKVEAAEEWKKINIENYEYYDDCNIRLDLNGDENEESIDIKSSGKHIIINGKEYVVNKRASNEKEDNKNTNSTLIPVMSNACNVNQYHIIDLNNDNIMEIIHRTYSDMISPITSYYTIYNFYNNDLYKVAELSFMGNIPNEIYVKNNTLKFEYWPYESPKNLKEKIVLNLQLNYLE